MTPQRHGITDQVAIVTGAVRGIGLAIARRLARDGARVVVWDRNAAAFDARSAGFDPVDIQTVDVADHASVARAFEATMERVGHLEILVNNAGINGPVVPAWEYPLDDFARVLAVNLGGVFNCCRVAVPTMRTARYGRIVNVASIAGKEGVPYIAPYAASKHGVVGFTKSIARELVDSGVLVNAIAPALTETELFAEMTPEHIAASKAKIPMGRLLTVDEIAALVAWVVGPECSFTTGFTFDLSGGRADY